MLSSKIIYRLANTMLIKIASSTVFSLVILISLSASCNSQEYLDFCVCGAIIFSINLFAAIGLKGWLCMAVNYNKLWKMMIDKKMTKTELTHLAGISTNAMAKLGRNEDVRVNTLEKLCTTLDCKLDDIVEFVPDSKE